MTRLRWKKRFDELPQTELDKYVLNLNQTKSFDWSKWSKGYQRIELEIGAGKGWFLTDTAQARPDTLFVGIEPFHALIMYIFERVCNLQLTNVRLLEGRIEHALHASETVEGFFPNNSLDAVYIYFPDPWPKAKHAKRRVVQRSLLDALVPLLKKNAKVYFASDVENYYNEALALFEAHPAYQVQGTWDHNSRPAEVFTHFDAKARQVGSNIHFFDARAC